MAVDYNPIRLYGNWTLGYALDRHVMKSVPVGEDPYGHMCFDTTRSEIGELIYKFKYRGRLDVLPEIIDTIVDFLSKQSEMASFDTIIPVPPTQDRPWQPTFELAEALAEELHVYTRNDILVNHSNIQAKGLANNQKNQLSGTITMEKTAKRKHSVLLIDDVYETGTTLSQCVDALRTDPLIDKNYVLAVTKTKN